MVRVLTGDALEEGAGVALTDGNDGAIIAALESGGAVVEAEAGLLFFWAVALEAVGGKEGLNVAGEVGGRGRGAGDQQSRGGADGEADPGGGRAGHQGHNPSEGRIFQGGSWGRELAWC